MILEALAAITNVVDEARAALRLAPIAEVDDVVNRAAAYGHNRPDSVPSPLISPSKASRA